MSAQCFQSLGWGSPRQTAATWCVQRLVNVCIQFAILAHTLRIVGRHIATGGNMQQRLTRALRSRLQVRYCEYDIELVGRDSYPFVATTNKQSSNRHPLIRRILNTIGAVGTQLVVANGACLIHQRSFDASPAAGAAHGPRATACREPGAAKVRFLSSRCDDPAAAAAAAAMSPSCRRFCR